MAKPKHIPNNKLIQVVVFASVFALIVLVTLAISRASSPYTDVESEAGTVASPANIINDSSASGNKAVQFNRATTTELTPVCANEASLLKFCDDFNGSAGSAIDTSKWGLLSGAASWGQGCWTSSANNITIDGNGNLKETVRKESAAACSNGPYTSGGVDSRGKFTFQYGKVEIRAKVACGGGVWPALWTSTGTGPAWPNSGEIDILEIMLDGGAQFNAQQTLHGGPQSGSWQLNYFNQSASKWCQAYHTYGVNWVPGEIDFTIDGAITHQIPSSLTPSGQTWPFDSYDQRILMDLQIGNNIGDNCCGGTIVDSDLPASMLIDYIKIYK
ncbi:MAG: glycoside hydrolase family 16 protein [Candidatus Saccharimonadales bacterium]